jgi:uncharacterized membrane protein YidH (DUF202 family)
MTRKPTPAYLAFLIVVGGAALMFAIAHWTDVTRPLQLSLLGMD